jgi:hypothetical protein
MLAGASGEKQVVWNSRKTAWNRLLPSAAFGDYVALGPIFSVRA